MKLIFGVLASIPILLFWIYANWIIILCGVIVVAILEKRHINPAKPLNESKISFKIEKIIADESVDSKVLDSIEIKKIFKEILEEKSYDSNNQKEIT